MAISAKIITDAYSRDNRITTIQLRYPRIIHSEFMTHRQLVKNSSSSRAIPSVTMINNIEQDLVYPLSYVKNQAGMFGKEILDDDSQAQCAELIQELWFKTKDTVEALDALKLHKQNKNRYLEPFQYIDVVTTATDWDNFFNLRIAHDAQPEINQLATVMKEVLGKSKPQELKDGEWHLPYITDADDAPIEVLKKCSVARCARTSFLKHDKTNPVIAEDLDLFEMLSSSMHLSPFEHVVRAVTDVEYRVMELAHQLYIDHEVVGLFNDPFHVGCFKGFVSFRRELEAQYRLASQI